MYVSSRLASPSDSGKDPGEPVQRTSNVLPTAWVPAREIRYVEWLEAGRRLGRVSRCSQWWIGDWLRYGSARWGEKYVEAARITGYDVHSLRNMAWLASRFQTSRRRDNLTWSHHAVVATLEVDQQEKWLDRCEADRLSVADLRIELRAARRRSETLTSSTNPSDPMDEPEAPADVIRGHFETEDKSLSAGEASRANGKARPLAEGLAQADVTQAPFVVCPQCGHRILSEASTP